MDQQHSGVRRASHKTGRRGCEGLWDWNLKSNRIHFSPGWMSLVGCLDDEVGNTPDEWFQRVHPEDRGTLMRDLDAARREGPCEFELRYRLRHRDGSYRWMASRALVVRDDDGQAIRLTGSQSDVTVETVTDPVTGLPNRLLLLDRLAQSIERTQRYEAFHFALLLFDLGRPAGYARKPGPNAPDPLLNAAARRLETSLRLPDVASHHRISELVARVQDDRCAILLDGLQDLSQAKHTGDRLLAHMLNAFTVSGREIRLSASIGIALSGSRYTQAEDAIRDAEAALHRAQMLGGSHCEVFDSTILKSEQVDLQLEGDFDSALQRREFELLYQPIVSIEHNRLVGFEALVRWQHPVLGTISPSDFISISERSGFIVPLGVWIVREACRCLREWRATIDQSKDLWISVNLSGVQLRDPALVEHISDALRESGLDGRSLAMELTESVAMDNPAGIITLLMRLRAMGIRISIDDFGTGYSSLAYLRQFPVDTVKIDRSFIRGIELDTGAAEIVAGLVAMAQRLGLHVVAEGVENAGQLAVLRSLRCESVQGQLFAKPLDATSAGVLLKTGLTDPSEEESDAETVAAAERRDVESRPAQARARRAPRQVMVLAMAALGVLVTAGMLSWFSGVSSEMTMAPAPLVENEPSMAIGPADEDDVTDVAATQEPAATEAQPSPAAFDASSPRPDASRSATSATRPVQNRQTADAPSPPVQVTASLEVVHQHRFGSCRGRLFARASGIEYVPAEDRANDAFAFKYTEFLQSLDGDTLTIRSGSRTYRFKAPDEQSTGNLHRMAESMARFRSM